MPKYDTPTLPTLYNIVGSFGPCTQAVKSVKTTDTKTGNNEV
jgi:hypothetical protein